MSLLGEREGGGGARTCHKIVLQMVLGDAEFKGSRDACERTSKTRGQFTPDEQRKSPLGCVQTKLYGAIGPDLFGSRRGGAAGGGGGWHKASVSDCLPLAAPIGLSPLLILTLCGGGGGLRSGG